jgi:hypothetical protein
MKERRKEGMKEGREREGGGERKERERGRGERKEGGEGKGGREREEEEKKLNSTPPKSNFPTLFLKLFSLAGSCQGTKDPQSLSLES